MTAYEAVREAIYRAGWRQILDARSEAPSAPEAPHATCILCGGPIHLPICGPCHRSYTPNGSLDEHAPLRMR